MFKIKWPKKDPYPLSQTIEQAIALVQVTADEHVKRAYTKKQILAACLKVAEYYAVPANITISALAHGDKILSRKFIEALVDIGREKHNIE